MVADSIPEYSNLWKRNDKRDSWRWFTGAQFHFILMSIKVNLWEQTQSQEGCGRISADVLSFMCNVVFWSHNYLILLVCVFELQVKVLSFQLSQPFAQSIGRLPAETHTHTPSTRMCVKYLKTHVVCTVSWQVGHMCCVFSPELVVAEVLHVEFFTSLAEDGSFLLSLGLFLWSPSFVRLKGKFVDF